MWQTTYEPEDLNSCKHFALSGTRAFVRRMLAMVPSAAEVLVGLHLHHNPWDDFRTSVWSWVQLSHAHCGGSTTGKFWCGLRPARSSLNVADLTSARRLRHYLRPLTQGPTCDPPSNPEETFDTVVRESGALHPGCLLPITDPRTRVIAPCVFSPTKWVIRNLMIKEVDACCDVRDDVVKSLDDGSIVKVPLAKCPFLFSPPAKLLGHFVDSIHIDRSPGNIDSGTMDSGSIDSSLETRSGGETKVLAKHNENIGGDALRLVPVQEDNEVALDLDPAQAADLDTIFGRHKAAKIDDAGINYDYWDAGVMSPWMTDTSFRRWLQEFQEKYDDLPTDAIRKLGLRRWR